MTKETANKIWDILVKHCGARDTEIDRSMFVHAQARNDSYSPVEEFRFCGSLGFGGKFWNHGRKWYVTCYQEDETFERMVSVEFANEALKALRRELNEPAERDW